MTVADIPGLTAYRLLPFFGYLIFSPRIRAPKKATASLLLLTLVALALLAKRDVSEILVRGPGALLYFAAVSVAVYQARGLLTTTILRTGFLGACLFAYMLVPALFYRNSYMIATVILGWQAALSAYSYCIDTAIEQTPSSISDCVSFILVNPCVVYAERGSVNATRDGLFHGWSRIGLGIFAWVFQSILQVAVYEAMRLDVPSGYARLVIQYGGAALILYCAHSGLASVQIGFSRWIGYDVPECFAYPFLSQSPEDFWRRWNIYLGSWIKRYVFFPTALSLRRAWPNAPRGFSLALAVLLSFMVVGLFHDYPRWLVSFGITMPQGTIVFVTFGGTLLLWNWTRAVVSEYAAIRRLRHWLAPVGRWMACLAFLHVAWGMIWLCSWLGIAP